MTIVLCWLLIDSGFWPDFVKELETLPSFLAFLNFGYGWELLSSWAEEFC